jgi:cbb3-type cytochrome oxidase maturation protein
MDILEFMIPGGILLGLCGLWFFFWTIRSSQYDDMEGAAHRILMEDDDKPLSASKDQEISKNS